MESPWTIGFSLELTRACPRWHAGGLRARVRNGPSTELVWEEVNHAVKELAGRPLDGVKTHSVIAATRAAYKACGKDPNRYRPSAEALRRRVVQGKGLYRVSLLVDLINLVSLRTGFSINGFDADRLVPPLEWGIGQSGEVYEAIGRGGLNIAGLPVLRDGRGPVGTPTSDHVRASIGPGTETVLIQVSGCDGPRGVMETLAELESLLILHAGAREVMRAVYPAG